MTAIDSDKLLAWIDVEFNSSTALNLGSFAYNDGREEILDKLERQIKEGVFDFTPLPVTIKPGDIVNHDGFQFPFLKNVKVDHVRYHTFGVYADLIYDGGLYRVPLDSLEVVTSLQLDDN